MQAIVTPIVKSKARRNPGMANCSPTPSARDSGASLATAAIFVASAAAGRQDHGAEAAAIDAPMRRL
ncbi:hypothetical protein MesoLj113b_45450 [Mesorhizobium sp. 113-3-3]|nr:hypothetical protein MesoLj113b_45450 [Mesorhizobium sp. 113-3-3]